LLGERRFEECRYRTNDPFRLAAGKCNGRADEVVAPGPGSDSVNATPGAYHAPSLFRIPLIAKADAGTTSHCNVGARPVLSQGSTGIAGL